MADFSSEYYRLKLEYDRTGSEAVKKQILEIEHEYWVQRDKEWAIEKEKIKKRRILEYNTFFQNNCHCISTLANYFQLESLYFPFPIFQSEDQLTHSARMVKTAIEEYDYNYPKTEKVIAYAQSGGKSIFFDRVKAGSNLLGGTNETGFMMTESGVYIHDTGEDTESIFIPYEDIYIFSFVRYNSKEYIYLNESIMFFSLGIGDEKKTIEWCLDFVKLLNHLKEIKLNRNKSFININNNISVRLPPRLSKKDKQVIECFIKKIKSQYLFSSCVYFADKSDKSIKKIESATDAYGIWDFRDGIIFCYDDTILGGAEDGFYVTDTRIYIHNKGGEKISIPLDELRNIKVMERYEKCLLWINYGEVDAIRIKTERIDRDDIYKIAELIKIIKDNFYDFSSEKELLKQMPNNDYETENDNARKRRIAESNKIKNEVKQDEAKMEEFFVSLENKYNHLEEFIDENFIFQDDVLSNYPINGAIYPLVMMCEKDDIRKGESSRKKCEKNMDIIEKQHMLFKDIYNKYNIKLKQNERIVVYCKPESIFHSDDGILVTSLGIYVLKKDKEMANYIEYNRIKSIIVEKYTTAADSDMAKSATGFLAKFSKKASDVFLNTMKELKSDSRRIIINDNIIINAYTIGDRPNGLISFSNLVKYLKNNCIFK
ncbi:MAG: hypothetical protein J6H31_11160 [Butyrivibrio sp.]|nr:hypothetical protein [Butyrivibrio sp.]